VSDVAAAPALVPAPRRRAPLLRALGDMLRHPTSALGLVLVALILFVALFADLLAPYAPAALHIKERLADPSAQHWLGTDQLGRDLLSRVLVGTRVAIGIALGSILLSLALSIVLGLVAGYGPRWLDALLILGFDSVASVPLVMLGLAAGTLLGAGALTVVLVIVLYSVPSYSRMVRSQALSLKGRDFVLAERAMNAGTLRILFLHLLPNLIGPLLIIACMDVAAAIALEASLSFLGIGIKPPTPSWGAILNEGFAVIRTNATMVVAGGVPLILATLGFTFFGEALRDALDPKLARGRTR
jgi:peptide/nickel transport system permease protein